MFLPKLRHNLYILNERNVSAVSFFYETIEGSYSGLFLCRKLSKLRGPIAECAQASPAHRLAAERPRSSTRCAASKAGGLSERERGRETAICITFLIISSDKRPSRAAQPSQAQPILSHQPQGVNTSSERAPNMCLEKVDEIYPSCG
jgi:hypothetical protein